MHIALLHEIRQPHPLPHRGRGREAIRGAIRGAIKGAGRAADRGADWAAERGADRRFGGTRHREAWTAHDAARYAATADLEAELARERDRLHELRSTVGGLVASYHLLQERQVELTSAARSRLEHLHDAELGRLERLLTDQAESPPGPVDLGRAIDTLVETLRLGGHEVRWSGTTALAWGCQDDVTQVVHVLLDNAIQHASGTEVEVTVTTSGDTVELRVHDLGPGAAPEVRDDLFQRGARRPGSPGQGIGLNIAHRLAGQMGAVLRFDPGDADLPGSTFVLSLPVLPEAAPRARAVS